MSSPAPGQGKKIASFLRREKKGRGIVRDERGQDQPEGKDDAQRSSGDVRGDEEKDHEDDRQF